MTQVVNSQAGGLAVCDVSYGFYSSHHFYRGRTIPLAIWEYKHHFISDLGEETSYYLFFSSKLCLLLA